MAKIELDTKPWKEAKPSQGFIYFIDVFRRNKENEK